MFYLQARDGCTDHRNQPFKRETRGGEKTQIGTRLESGNTFKPFFKQCTHTVHSSVDGN